MPNQSWKELGYVPDSEDEQDILVKSPIQQSTENLAAPHDHVELQKDDAVLKVFKKDNLAATIYDLPASSSSSSLSDIDSFVLSPSPSFLQVQPVVEIPTSHDTPLQSEPLDAFSRISPEYIDDGWVSRRTLRQRTAIQQNPYTVEGLHYRHLVRESGIKPIQVVNKQQELQPADDRDDEEFALDEASQENSPVRYLESSSPTAGFLQQDHVGVLPQSAAVSTAPSSIEDEDIFAIERDRRAQKRRKLHAIQESANVHKKITSPFTVAGFDTEGHSLPATSPKPRHWNAVFRSPPRLPSFLRSNQNQEGRQNISIDLEDDLTASEHSDGEVTRTRQPGRRAVESSSEDADDMEAEPDLDEAKQIRLLGKRLAGVLPASFVKLDIAKQQKKDLSAKKHLKAEQRRLHTQYRRGMARPLTLKTLNNHNPLLSTSQEQLAETGATEGFSPGRDASKKLATSMQLSDSLSSDPGSDMEHDIIDYMRPTRERQICINGPKKRPSAANASIKQYLSNGQIVNAPKKTGPSSVIHRRNATYGIRNSQKDSKRKSKLVEDVPRLSILDFPVDSMLYHEQLPLFLRIARRQARKSSNLARCSPRKRFIQLQTREDTVDATEMLESWRRGKLQPAKVQVRKNAMSKEATIPQKSTLKRKIQLTKPARKKPVQTQPTGLERLLEKQEKEHRSEPSLSLKKWAEARQTSRLQAIFRPGQLEASDVEFGLRHRKTVFEQTLRNADNDFALRKIVPGVADAEIAKYLDDGSTELDDVEMSTERPITHSLGHKKPRKKTARHIDVVRMDTFPQFTFKDTSRVNPTPTLDQIARQDHTLGGYLANYSDTLNVYPLPHNPDSHFDSTTFIGSGCFAKAILMNSRNMNVPNGQLSVSLSGREYMWSAWSEPLVEIIRQVFNEHVITVLSLRQTETTPSNSQYPTVVEELPRDLEVIIHAFSEVVYFTDDVDRISCGTVLIESIEPLLSATYGLICTIVTRSRLADKLLRSIALQLTLIVQVIQISGLTTQHQGVLLTGMKQLSEAFLQFGIMSMKHSLEKNSDRLSREAGFNKDDVGLEAIIILHHILQVSQVPNENVWTMLNRQFVQRINATQLVSVVENIWKDIYSILPALEVDVVGNAMVGQRFALDLDDWTAIKAIIKKACEAYQSQITARREVSIYIRIVLRRCHHLIQGWGWRRCESVVGAIFDFMGKQNKLQPLYFEEPKGSPRFLQLLDQNPSLELDEEDGAFGIFTKLVGLAIDSTRGIFGEKKVDSLIIRCTPNHGRQYSKEAEMRIIDSEALRNHHDLLCTLFWKSKSSPIKRRLLTTLRSLVDHSFSHRSACQSSMRAWTNLIRYQLSTKDDPEFLDEFASWQQEILHQALTHYFSIRADMTRHENSKHGDDGGVDIDHQSEENFISAFKVLGDVTFAMKVAMKCARSQSQMAHFLEHSGLQDLFRLSDDDRLQAVNLMSDVLEIYQLFMALPVSTSDEVSQSKDESQDYGEWPEPDISVDFLQKPLSQFISNIFGLESTRFDSICQSLINTWVSVLNIKAQKGEVDWSDVLGPYGEYSWSRLNETKTKHKFTALFYSAILQVNATCFAEHQREFFSVWLVSLVERDALLSHQHVLTTSLLNLVPDHPLLHNLPFWKNSDGNYNISLNDIRTRRLSLLSTLLSNMQAAYEKTTHTGGPRETIRQIYSQSLQHMMNAMKANYRTLQQSDASSGTYMQFIHEVIGYLHHYTSSICTVDDYFTRSAEFPLPTQDPNYVVSKLRGYETKLKDDSGIKQLFHYFIPLCERAVLENRVESFSDQLVAVTTSKIATNTCMLQDVFLKIVFPAYIEKAFKSEAGWALCIPILPVIAQSIGNLIYCIDAIKDEILGRAEETMLTVLSVMEASIYQTVVQSVLFGESHVLHVLSWYFNIMTASLSPMDYIRRITRKPLRVQKYVSVFKEFSIFAAQIVLKIDAWPPQIDTAPECSAHQSMRQYFSNNLQHSLTAWRRDGNDCYHVESGGRWRKVPVDIGTLEEEKDALIASIEEFHHVLNRMTSL